MPCRHRYFNCSTPSREPLEWDPHDPPAAGSWPLADYFGRAFAEMDGQLPGGPLTFYLTFDTSWLPSYGRDVVAVVLDNEVPRIPDYVDRVRAVYMNMGTRPETGCRVLSEPSALSAAAALMTARSAARWLPGAAAHARAGATAARTGRAAGTVRPIACGTFNQLDLPVKPFAERSSTIMFAGSVTHRASAEGRFKALVSPKGISRRSMLREVERLAGRHPEIGADIGITEAFMASKASDKRVYSERLMDAKLSLVPRGNVAISLRFLEALRYGCIVVTDHLSSEWPYAQAPVVRVRDWRELEAAVLALLADEPRMQALHEQALAWWHSACSEAATGRYLAGTLSAGS